MSKTNTTTIQDPTAHLENLQRVADEAASARYATEAAALDANRKTERARSDLSAARRGDEPAAVAAASSALDAATAREVQAGDAFARANEAYASAIEASQAAHNDPSLASARIDVTRSRLAGASRARDKSALVARDASVVGADAERLLSAKAAAVTAARDGFDADATKRAAFIKARDGHADAKVDADRVKRLAADAEALASADAATWRRARLELVRAEFSHAALKLRSNPIAARFRAALGELMIAHQECQALSESLHKELAAGLDEAEAAAAERKPFERLDVPSTGDLRDRALAELRAELTARDASDDEARALMWLERGAR